MHDKKVQAIKRKLAQIIHEADEQVEELLVKFSYVDNSGKLCSFLAIEHQLLADDYYQRGQDQKNKGV